jgi:zinc transporter
MTLIADSINAAVKDHTATHGLICGFAMLPDQRIQDLAGGALDQALAPSAAKVWLHFNARISHARDWIQHCERAPEAARRFLLDTDDHKCLGRSGEGLIAVISDIRYDFGFDFDPEQIATLRFYLDRDCLISTRQQPSSAADQLRTEIKQGRYFDSTAKLMIDLFESQVEKLNQTITRACDTLNDIEDQALAGRMRGQHAQLGVIRRLVVRLHHHFAPEYRMLQRLGRRPPDWFSESDHIALQDLVEAFRDLIDDLTETQERAKLLQEELAARLAEETNSNLYIVSLFTALLLPPSLIAGIFGMNVAGLPGLKDEMAFWWVMLGMAAVSSLILLILYLRRLF